MIKISWEWTNEILGHKIQSKNVRAKLGVVTHENGPMRFFGSRAILEVVGQKPKLIFWSQNF